MKKLIFTLSCLIFFSEANAENAKNYYVGAGIQSTELGLENGEINSYKIEGKDYFKNSANNVNLFTGYNLKDWLAVELGYFYKNSQTKTNNSTGLYWTDSGNKFNTKSEYNVSVVDLNGVAKLDIDNRKKLKILGIAGLSYIKSDFVISGLDNQVVRITASDKENTLGFNIGAGLEFEITDNLSVRGIAKYTKVNSSDYIKDLTSYGIAGKYSF